MSVEHTAWVWTYSQAEGGALLVALALADCVGRADGGTDCSPKRETLAKRVRLSVSQVSRCLAELEEFGEIERLRTRDGNRYRLLMPESVRPPIAHPCDIGGRMGATSVGASCDIGGRMGATSVGASCDIGGRMPRAGATADVETSTTNVKGNVKDNGNVKVKVNTLGPEEENQTTLLPSPATQVWKHYQRVIAGATRRNLDSTRQTCIRRALKVRNVDECCKAIDALAASQWHNGENPERRKYLDIQYALGQKSESADERIDRMIAKVKGARRPLSNVPMTVEQWIERFQPEHRPRVRPDIIVPIEAMLENPGDRDLEPEARRQLRRMWGYGAEPVIEGTRITGIKAKSSTAPEPPMFHRR